MLLAPARLGLKVLLGSRRRSRQAAGDAPQQISPLFQKLDCRPKRSLQPFSMRAQQTFSRVGVPHAAAELRNSILAQFVQRPAAIRTDQIELLLLFPRFGGTLPLW